MISENVKTYCSEDPSLIENYELAIADKTQTWHCHHRAEILPCERYSQAQLDKYGLLEHVPASQLIFLTKAEHSRLHGRNRTSSTLKKLSKAALGNKWGLGNKSMTGKKHSQQTKDLMSRQRLGNQHAKGKHWRWSIESRKNVSNSLKGLYFWNNGQVNCRSRTCPGPEWIRGMVESKNTEGE